MTDDLVPWLVAGGLAVVVVVLAVLLRRHQTSARSELDAAERARAAELAQREAEHRDATARLEADRAAQVAAADAARRDALTEAEESRALARRGMKWEEASEQAVLRACRAAGVSGVLMTNVVFVPVGETEQGPWRKFVAQADHVLVSESGRGLVIENKRWGGIVFDGRRPSEVHPAFRNLVDESSLVPPFAVQVRSRTVLNGEEEAENWWQVRVQAKGGVAGAAGAAAGPTARSFRRRADRGVPHLARHLRLLLGALGGDVRAAGGPQRHRDDEHRHERPRTAVGSGLLGGEGLGAEPRPRRRCRPGARRAGRPRDHGRELPPAGVTRDTLRTRRRPTGRSRWGVVSGAGSATRSGG
ncbi:hypothetical protein [Curtobacterium sp. MCPF17_052]|uniref:hypothetical protein n=1 Tax=Curtobacterium sp. MCPF17_052 TaxID=2175655 RepID=UPI0024DF73E2|nr:hypothetical protein [Curtobacterium sp. MCPF17_052]WIB11792.1 hypothetical protein DEJ36_12975 [Curtobacterium sp. MCPF17_052]